jgi:hypothetical protein
MVRRGHLARAGALLVLVGGSQLSCSTPPVIVRADDPVVLTGAQVAALSGVSAGRVVAFRAGGGAWAQVPVQVDEKVATTMTKVYNGLTSFYSASTNIPVTLYADPGTFVGADTDPAVDADDEIAFMARDAGAQATDLAPPPGTSGGGVEVRIADPGDPGATSYVYLFGSDGTLDPGAGQKYVDYRFSLTSGDYKTTYKRDNGPNPENSTVTGSTYTVHFADRWLMDSLTLTKGDRPTADLIDRMKFGINLLCVRNENTFDTPIAGQAEGAFIVNRSGPVRALRSYVGSNSGPNTQNTYAFYDTSYDEVIDLRVHAIPNVTSHLDLSRQAYGMTFRNPQVPNGVPIDGSPDNVPAALPSWWTITGPQGGIALSTSFDTNATADPITTYEDNTNASADARCTGDTEAVGDAGAVFNSSIQCTDPGTSGCTAHLQSRVRAVATAATVTPAQAQAIAQQGLQPLTVTVGAR